MGDILILGGGFAGLEVARLLSRNRMRLDGRRILLVDRKETFDFLPLLPDVAGGAIEERFVKVGLEASLERLGVAFIHDEVFKIDCAARQLHLKKGHVLRYEFLVLSCGSSTHFYGMQQVERNAMALDSACDAIAVGAAVARNPKKKICILGGGYTGVELASHCAVFLRSLGIKKYAIHLIERSKEILGVLPSWLRGYCRCNLGELHIDIHTGSSLVEVTKEALRLSNGNLFKDYILIWAAGVQTAACVRELDFEKDGQGRLFVDSHMRFSEQCFAIGDTAHFRHKEGALRMAVQFSLAQAGVAAKNIVRLSSGKKKLAKYRPLDLGYFIPMANRRAAGEVLGLKVRGRTGWLLHYAMCLYRSITLQNRVGIFFNLLGSMRFSKKGRGRKI